MGRFAQLGPNICFCLICIQKIGGVEVAEFCIGCWLLLHNQLGLVNITYIQNNLRISAEKYRENGGAHRASYIVQKKSNFFKQISNFFKQIIIKGKMRGWERDRVSRRMSQR